MKHDITPDHTSYPAWLHTARLTEAIKPRLCNEDLIVATSRVFCLLFQLGVAVISSHTVEPARSSGYLENNSTEEILGNLL